MGPWPGSQRPERTISKGVFQPEATGGCLHQGPPTGHQQSEGLCHFMPPSPGCLSPW